MKIRPVWAELFLADGRTDMTKLTVTSRNVANAPNNGATLMTIGVGVNGRQVEHMKIDT